MIKKTIVTRLTFILLTLTFFGATPPKMDTHERNRDANVQLFDIKTRKIINTMTNNAQFQAEAKKWLKSVTGISPKLTIGHQCGHILRIPLPTFIDVVLDTRSSQQMGEQQFQNRAGKQNPNITLQTKDVFLIYCPSKTPLLLIFSKERKSYLLTFNADVAPFMKKILAQPLTTP